MKSRLLPGAEADLRWFLHYYGKVFPQGRAGAVMRYKNARTLLEQHPQAGQLQQNGKSRVFVIPKTHFTLEYVIYKDFIGILRIHDQRRNPARLFDDDLQ